MTQRDVAEDKPRLFFIPTALHNPGAQRGPLSPAVTSVGVDPCSVLW